MIAFATSIAEPAPYERYARPGIERVAEPDSEILAFAGVDTLARSLNILLDQATRLKGLEALVLVDPAAELTDPRFCAVVREALRDEQLAVAGAVGARGIDSIAWWEGETVSCARGFVYRYSEHGGGELPGLPWRETVAAPCDVDAVDGMVMILSPWAVQNLRFDETLARGHGVDIDFCLRARAAGRKISTLEFAVAELRPLNLVGEIEPWTAAHVDFSRKWHDRIPGRTPTQDIRTRSRRMEAERESTRSTVYFDKLGYDARLEPLEAQLDELRATPSWRLTEPLRRVNKWRHDRATPGTRS